MSSSRYLLRDLLIVLALALPLRVAYYVNSLQDPADRQMTADSRVYRHLAYRVVRGEGYGRTDSDEHAESSELTDWVPEICRPPGYPMFLVAFNRLTGPQFHGAIVAQNLLNLALCVISFGVCRVSFGRPAGLLAGVLAALDVQNVAQSNLVMSAATYGFMLVMTAWSIGFAVQRGSGGWGIVAGLVLGLTTLIRPTSMFVPGILLVAGLIVWGLRRRFDRQVLTLLVIAVIGYAPVGAWTVRNGVVAGEYVFSTMARFNLLRIYGGFTLARALDVSMDAGRDMLCDELGYSRHHIRNEPMPPEARRRLREITLRTIRQYPVAFLTEQALRAANVIGGPDKAALLVAGWPAPNLGLLADPKDTEQADRPSLLLWLPLIWQVLFLAAVYILGLWTIWQMVFQRRFPLFVYVAAGLAVYTLALSSGLGDPRMRAPVVPLLIIVAAASLAPRYSAKQSKAIARREAVTQDRR